MSQFRFIKKEIVLFFHQQLIKEYGGLNGIRDEGLLDSALAQPHMTISGDYVHKDIFEMAAAYGYHLCNNHPFLDGNKRVALVVMDTFLQVNGWDLIADEKSMYQIMLQLAESQLTKLELAEWLRKHCENLK
jgi:death-on-curing protein